VIDTTPLAGAAADAPCGEIPIPRTLAAAATKTAIAANLPFFGFLDPATGDLLCYTTVTA
jgi:hypothetical protein